VSFGPAFPLWHKGRSRQAKEARPAGKYRFALSGIGPVAQIQARSVVRLD
jgi:hypothetical protein